MATHQTQTGTPTELPSDAEGTSYLHDPALNKGTAFTQEEREALHLQGLLPPRVFSQQQQLERVLGNLRRKPNALEKYIFMIGLQDRNETLFYRLLMEHLEELMPVVYTPTVGQACEEYGLIFRRPRGLYITAEDRGRVADVIANWPVDDVRVVVVTDGERILGLGDLGANGMGIPIGKLSLYTACAGVPPAQCLPVTLDVGTENGLLLQDPLYIGLPQRRLRGEAYDAFVDEFIEALLARFPRALVQFEDFGTANAFRLLDHYQDRICTFNDDIQGTAAVTLAGLYSALRITGGAFEDQRILFLGAGEAGTGVGNLVRAALDEQGGSGAEQFACWFVDSKGLIVKSRTDLAPHKRPLALDHAPMTDLQEILEELRPTAIIGASGQPGLITREMLEAMARFNERPVVFALSNPTSKAECTAEEAYQHTDGRAIFASGSPFPLVRYEGRTLVPGQGNNAYIFPGVGLGVLLSGARRVTPRMFYEAALALAQVVSEEDLAHGRIYPPLTRIREVSVAIAVAVMRVAYDADLATEPEPEDLQAYVRAQMYEPTYHGYTR